MKNWPEIHPLNICENYTIFMRTNLQERMTLKFSQKIEQVKNNTKLEQERVVFEIVLLGPE